jgi:hypothetical protein
MGILRSPYGDARPSERRGRLTGLGGIAALGVVLLLVGLVGLTVDLTTDSTFLPLVVFGSMMLMPVGAVLLVVALLGRLTGGRRYR